MSFRHLLHILIRVGFGQLESILDQHFGIEWLRNLDEYQKFQWFQFLDIAQYHVCYGQRNLLFLTHYNPLIALH